MTSKKQVYQINGYEEAEGFVEASSPEEALQMYYSYCGINPQGRDYGAHSLHIIKPKDVKRAMNYRVKIRRQELITHYKAGNWPSIVFLENIIKDDNSITPQARQALLKRIDLYRKLLT